MPSAVRHRASCGTAGGQDQDAVGEGRDEAALLHRGMKSCGGHEAPLGVPPANEGFHPFHRSGANRHLRLVVQEEFVPARWLPRSSPTSTGAIGMALHKAAENECPPAS